MITTTTPRRCICSRLVGKGLPIAYALDGYPIYGLTEPDGSPLGKLDEFNGHETATAGYHYHASTKYPYVNGGFHGEIMEREQQVDPQPRANPVRQDQPPLRGAKITNFTTTADGKVQQPPIHDRQQERRGQLCGPWGTGAGSFNLSRPKAQRRKKRIRRANGAVADRAAHVHVGTAVAIGTDAAALPIRDPVDPSSRKSLRSSDRMP